MPLPTRRIHHVLFTLTACVVFHGLGKAQQINAAELLAPVGSIFDQYSIQQNFPWDTLQGPDVTWDYPWVEVDSTNEITYSVIDPAVAPDAASYPAANRTLRSWYGDSHDYIIDRFYDVQADRMNDLGSVGPVLSYVYDTPERILGWPMSLGDTLHTTYCFGSDGFGVQYHFCGDSYVTFDAVGTLVLPYGTYTDVKHLTYWRSTLETTIPWTEPTHTIKQQWFAPGFAFPILEVQVYISADGFVDPSGWLMDQASLTGVPDAGAAHTLSAFPNPTTNFITIQRTTTGAATIELLAADGRVVRTERFTAGELQHTMGMSDLPSGTYTVRNTGNGMSNTLRIVKVMPH